MSHIPNAAIPHAKVEPEHKPERGTRLRERSGLLIGGAVAAGLALAAAPFLAWGAKPKKKVKGKSKKKAA